MHIDNPVPVTVSCRQTREPLVAKHLLHYDRAVHPRYTFLTADGRYALAVILGDAADALVAAGLLDAEAAARVAAALAARDVRRKAAPAMEQISPPPLL